MKYFVIGLLFFGFNVAIGQSTQSENPARLSSGELKVEGIDPMGALVTVVYNKEKVKVYQERTLNGETTFAPFDAGSVIEYGTIVKPALVNNDIRIIETDEP